MKKINCPFCGAPSFVSHENQFFCFSCGMGGDRTSYLRAFKGYTYKDAATLLKTSLLPEEQPAISPRKIYEALSKTAEFYFSNRSLCKSSYFKKRKLKKETVAKFQLGYAEGNKNLYSFLKKEGVDDSVMEAAGVIYTDIETGEKKEKFWKRIMFPIKNESGQVIGFGGRVLDDAKPKYLNSSESAVFDKSHNLYALDLAKASLHSFFLLAEGYVDVISLHQNGFDNAVASLGTAFTGGQAELLAKYCKPVYIVYDSDDAGQKAAERAVPILLAENIDTKVVSVAPYKDVDELLVKEGSVAFRERVANALDGKCFLAKSRNAEEVAKLLLAEID